MENSYEFSLYGRCDDQVNGPFGYEYLYWSVPQITSVGSDVNDFVYNSAVYVQPNIWYENVSYDTPPATTYGGSFWPNFQEYYDVNDYVYYQPNYIPLIPTQYHLYCSYQPVYYVYTPVYQEYYVPSPFYTPTPTYNASVSSRVDTSPFFENEVLPPLVEQNVDAYEEFNSSSQNIGNGVIDDMYGSMEEMVGEEITSCHLSYAEYPEIMNDAVVANEEENDKSVRKKTYVNRGVVKDPAAYREFCRSVEDRIKKIRPSSPEKKIPICRDNVEESSAFRKFISTTEDRRKMLGDSSVGKKSFINRGTLKDPASYRRFCQTVEDRIKKTGSPENSEPFGVKDFIAKHDSKVSHEEQVAHEGSSQRLMHRILKSDEYLHVQDNLKNPKHYSDMLYKQVLKKQNKSSLMEILPSIIEESFTLDDVSAGKSCGESHVAEPLELDLNDEHKPVIIKRKRPKNRFKSFRKWVAKTFCCCCTTNQPP